MRTLLLSLFLAATSLAGHAATTNVVFTWDVPGGGQPATGFAFYERIGATRTLLGGTTTNRFTVTGWTVGQSRTFTVVATNLWGESPEATPYVAPPLPATPANLQPAGFSFVTPVPGVLELSRDLTDWRERLRISSATPTEAHIELVQIPSEPILFARVKPQPTPAVLPTP